MSPHPMEVVWHPNDRKHWQAEQEAWLCFKHPRSSHARAVILHEGSHHYFTEMHITRPSGKRISRRLDGPGPFEVEFKDIGDCCVLVRTRFLRHERNPQVVLGGGEGSSSEYCAEIIGPDGNEQVSMPITDDVRMRNTTTRMLALEEIVRIITATPTSAIRLVPSSSPPYYRLTQPSDVPTSVYHLPDDEIDARITPGAELGAAFASLAAVPVHVIAPGLLAPLVTGGATFAKPAVVLPVRHVKNSHITGPPLALKPLIHGFEVKKRAPWVTASWSWAGPRNWTRVLLAWRAYDDAGNWADMDRQTRDISFNEYNLRNNVQLFRIPDYFGWNVAITATPYLVHDRESRDAPQTSLSFNITL
ncbi:MAG: hypothetical protein JNG86_17925 [Verrucomicrobiaceae bacterium]|nr:hypothetical protein [Verrucomicrobiaceae bacterium]